MVATFLLHAEHEMCASSNQWQRAGTQTAQQQMRQHTTAAMLFGIASTVPVSLWLWGFFLGGGVPVDP